MNQFSPRNEAIASVSAADRLPATLRPVVPVAQVPRTESGRDARVRPAATPPPPTEAVADAIVATEETARAFATYSRLHSEIATVVAALAQPPRQGPVAVAQADDALVSMIPAPSVVLPLPPADEDMVAFVGQVAQSIARQAAQTRAAHASISPATVDAVTA